MIVVTTHSLEALEVAQIRQTADFVPAFVGEPCVVGVRDFVLKANASSQEEHEFIVIQVTFGPVCLKASFKELDFCKVILKFGIRILIVLNKKRCCK